MAPSNETEAEMLERRKVEALERIAKALEALPLDLTKAISNPDGELPVWICNPRD